MVSDKDWRGFLGTGGREARIYKKKFTLYSVSHEEPQLNILSYKAASDMFSLEAVFCP